MPDGVVLPWWSDRERMRAVLKRFAPRDCERFLSLDTASASSRGISSRSSCRRRPICSARGFAGFARAAALRHAVPRHERAPDRGPRRFATGSLGEFLDRSLDSPHLKSLVLANSLYGKHGGPYDPGTLFGLLFHLLGGGAEAKQGFVGHVMGGMGAITQAMAAACVAQASRYARCAPSHRCSIRSGRADGCRAGGRHADRCSARRLERGSEAHVPGSRAAAELDDQIPRGRARHQDGWPLRQAQFRAGRGAALSAHPDADALRSAQFTFVPWLEGAQRCYESARQRTQCTSSSGSIAWCPR